MPPVELTDVATTWIPIDGSATEAVATDGKHQTVVVATEEVKPSRLQSRDKKIIRVLQVVVADDDVEEQYIHLTFTWSGKAYELDIAGSDRY